jgi:uncharacterized repeat protein (TIGR02543 family)
MPSAFRNGFFYTNYTKGVFNMKNIFKLFAIIVFVAIIGFSIVSCGGDDPDPKPDPNPPPATVSVTGVSLNKSSTTVIVGGKETLTATVAPNNATNKNVTWSTSDPTKATVTNGVVTAVAAGSAVITATTADGNKTANCTVTVSASAVAVTGVSLNKSSTSLTVGGTEILTATIMPSGATNQNVNWSSSNTAVATVNGGTVTAVSAGSATITATTVDGNRTATCTVTVTTPTYTVQYNANGGTGTMANSTHTIGTSQALTANGFTRTGYLFVGWSLNSGGTGTIYYNSQSVNNLTTTAGETVNLFAKWAEGNMYYGVIGSSALNALKGTAENPLAINSFNMYIANPSANSNVHITTISTSTEKTIEFSGNNYWFVLVPKNLGNIKLIGGLGEDNALTNTKAEVTFNGIEYFLHHATTSGNCDNLRFTLRYN